MWSRRRQQLLIELLTWRRVRRQRGPRPGEEPPARHRGLLTLLKNLGKSVKRTSGGKSSWYDLVCGFVGCNCAWMTDWAGRRAPSRVVTEYWLAETRRLLWQRAHPLHALRTQLPPPLTPFTRHFYIVVYMFCGFNCFPNIRPRT